MEYKEDFIEYWKNDYIDILHEFKDFIEDDSVFIRGEIHPETIIEEKPDDIPQQIWDTLFASDSSKIKNYIELESNRFYTLSLENYSICISTRGIKFAIAVINPNTIDEREYLKSDVFEYWLDKVIGNNWIDNAQVHILFKIAKEMYGEQNVSLIPQACLDPIISGITSNYKGVILIRHESFWCKDDFGVSILIEDGFTAILFDSDGQLSGSRPFKFTCSKRDPVYLHYRLYHPHVQRSEQKKQMRFKEVCTGEDSPINMALSTWRAEINEDTAFNLLLNYQNLLSKEDEQGVPYQRMRELMKYTSNTSIPTISKREVIEAILDEVVSITVNKTDSKFKININQSSINNLITDEGNGNSFLNTNDDRIYTKQLDKGDLTDKIYGSFIFNGDKIEVGIDQHDPLRFDFSGVNKDHPQWENASKRLPQESEIAEIETRLNTIVNYKLIDLYNVNKISHEFEEELIGLNKVGRTANVDDLV